MSPFVRYTFAGERKSVRRPCFLYAVGRSLTFIKLKEGVAMSLCGEERGVALNVAGKAGTRCVLRPLCERSPLRSGYLTVAIVYKMSLKEPHYTTN